MSGFPGTPAGCAGFNVQGHRGARGLKPENTLPAFEVAFDLGVSSVETDLHLSRDGVPVIIHDPVIPASDVPVRSLALAELQQVLVDVNPEPARFPDQDRSVTPLARLFAEQRGINPYAIPSLTDLFAFAAAYAGDLGRQAGKTDEQRERVQRIGFDLELKRIPFRPESIGDACAGGVGPGLFERQVLTSVWAAGVRERSVIRSFDHRSVCAVRQLEPRIRTAALVAGTAPASVVEVARAAGAQIYGPEFEFLDEPQVSALHGDGILVWPWTVNERADWERLLAWGVDGITTDYPDRLLEFLHRA